MRPVFRDGPVFGLADQSDTEYRRRATLIRGFRITRRGKYSNRYSDKGDFNRLWVKIVTIIALLLVILLVIWPLSILVKLIWVVNKLVCCVYPNVVDFGEVLERTGRELTNLEEKIFEKINI